MSDDERRNADFFPEHLHVLREKLDGETCNNTCLLFCSLMLLCAPRQAHGGGAKTRTFRRAASWKVAQQGW